MPGVWPPKGSEVRAGERQVSGGLAGAVQGGGVEGRGSPRWICSGEWHPGVCLLIPQRLCGTWVGGTEGEPGHQGKPPRPRSQARWGAVTWPLFLTFCHRFSLSCRRGWPSRAVSGRMSLKTWCLSRTSRKSTLTCRGSCVPMASRPTSQVLPPRAGGRGSSEPCEASGGSPTRTRRQVLPWESTPA